MLIQAGTLSAQTNEKDVAAAADRHFKSGNYTEALPLFAQLLSNNAAEVKYSYYYGVCRYMRGVNVADAISHLEKAAAKNTTPPDVNFYLARCYHLTYHFTEAISFYEKFKKTASPQQMQNFEIDLNIQMCRNAVNLPDKSDRYLINDKKIVDENHFLTLYQLDPLRDGKILVMTDDYKSGTDKKRNEKQYLYLDAGSNKLYYSSRGIDGEQSSDIMLAHKKINKWDKALKLKEGNSKYDEINPTAAKDGKVIYFSAKSPQSMGGFDIFKIEYNAESGTYGKPENLGAPINSPFDDFLYASSNIERTNYITSTRDCEKGKVCVIKFDENEPTDGYILIKGKFFNFDRPNEFNVNIIFFDQQSWKNLGEARVDSKTGEYSIKVPGAARYGCKIDVVGYSLLLGDFILRRDKKTVNQEIIINKQNNGQERLAIKNTYTEDAMLLFAQAKTKETQGISKAQTTASIASSIASKKETKRETIYKTPQRNTPLLADTPPKLEAKKTVNWKTEQFEVAAAIKPKEDKEILAWAKEESKNKSVVQPTQAQVKKQDAPAFNLENISLADLESQPKEKPTQKRQSSAINSVTDNSTKDNSKRSDLSIASAKTKSADGLNTPAVDLALNNTAKRTGKSTYIKDLPPIGYEILDENDRAKKEIVVSPLAENKTAKPTETTQRAVLNISKTESIKQKQIELNKSDLALKVNKNAAVGNVNYIAALPDVKAEDKVEGKSESNPVNKELVRPTALIFADTKTAKQLETTQPTLSLAAIEKTGKSNYVASLPAPVENTQKALQHNVDLAQLKSVKPLEVKQPELNLANSAKTGKANYIASLPSPKPDVDESKVAANNTPAIKKTGNVSMVTPKTISSINNNQTEMATVVVKDKTGKVNYIKSLPEPTAEENVRRFESAIATITPKEIKPITLTAKKETLAVTNRAGKVKHKLPLEKAGEENQHTAQSVTAKTNAKENTVPSVLQTKETRTEIAVVELTPAAPRETDVASLRYRFRAFQNKSDAQVKEIITRSNTGGLGF